MVLYLWTSMYHSEPPAILTKYSSRPDTGMWSSPQKSITKWWPCWYWTEPLNKFCATYTSSVAAMPKVSRSMVQCGSVNAATTTCRPTTCSNSNGVSLMHAWQTANLKLLLPECYVAQKLPISYVLLWCMALETILFFFWGGVTVADRSVFVCLRNLYLHLDKFCRDWLVDV